jgi:hypothetical protein
MAPRPARLLALLGAVLMLLAGAVPARAQVVTGGDFDICDYCGNLEGNTLRLRGRAGFGTFTGRFVLINGANDAQDVDRDGYTPGVDFLNLFLQDVTDFRNQADPDQVIQARNLVVGDFLSPLRNGFQNIVGIAVNIPDGTPAGIYRGSVVISDSVNRPIVNANGESLRSDIFFIEIEVLPSAGLGLVEGETATPLDSLVLRGRSGQTVSGVFRAANLGNAPLQNVRVDATDLVATSGTGLRIRADRITFTPAVIQSVGFGDTARVTVTVRIPLGLLAGRYRGELIVQGDNVATQRVPFVVIVTTAGDLVFENNPVYGRDNGVAIAIFNADAGTQWNMAVFDMLGIVTYRDQGTVFAGGAATGGGLATAGDEAVRTTWPLINGRREPVAAGMYYVVVNAVQDGQRRQLRGKLMVIR